MYYSLFTADREKQLVDAHGYLTHNPRGGPDWREALSNVTLRLRTGADVSARALTSRCIGV